MLEYLSFDKVIACGGSWMVTSELLKSGNFEEITRLCRQAKQKMLGFEVAHIGINCENDSKADKTAALLSSLFNFDRKDGASSIYVSEKIEITKKIGRGEKGHIAVKTNDVERAVCHLKNLGVEADMETTKYDDKGKLKIVYLKNDFAGFAIHLLQK
jgi:2-dehydro-3-deoxyphosphogluconate aldolase/(4S)-4-hydroxy-2-oxoglutarate aldolase